MSIYFCISNIRRGKTSHIYHNTSHPFFVLLQNLKTITIIVAPPQKKNTVLIVILFRNTLLHFMHIARFCVTSSLIYLIVSCIIDLIEMIRSIF